MSSADAPSDRSEVVDAAELSDTTELSERDLRILEMESRTFRFVGAKERAIREQLAMSKVAYYVRLNTLLDDPAALRAAPALVNRLRGRRTSAEEPASPGQEHRVA